MNTAVPGRWEVKRHWLFVLCLMGLDYFSTLAYLPSVAARAAGPLAPLAALLVVIVTWLFAVPVYSYLVGRSPNGQGTIGLLEQLITGWRGKLVALTFLGFAAADFVVTRSLSIADAAEHVIHNPRGSDALDGLARIGEAVRSQIGAQHYERLSPYVTRLVVVTVSLSLLTSALWLTFRRGFTRTVAIVAAVVVACYLGMVSIVIASGMVYLARHPGLVTAWLAEIHLPSTTGMSDDGSFAPWMGWLGIAIWAFPQLCLGLSGFELTMVVAPLVGSPRQSSSDDAVGRVRNTRRLIVTAVALMGVLLIGATWVTTLLVPANALQEAGAAQHRALAYLAHGGPLGDGQSADVLNGLFGEHFGTLFDVATMAILCLAGASVMVGLGRLVPVYLYRMGMDLSWAGNVGIVVYLLNAVILIVTVVFRASLTAQLWAYATSVLMLLAGASLVAALDVYRRRCQRPHRRLALVAFLAAFGFFAVGTAITVWINQTGLAIALAFVVTILITSFISRWLRSTELRFQGFDFADAASHARWQKLCDLERLILVPHRPGLVSLAERNRTIHSEYLLSPQAPLVFVEVTMGDPSEFYQRPLISIERESTLEVIRVSKVVSAAHVLAALALELAKVGRPPTLIFGWSFETPLAANLGFLLLGQGNVPWMVKALVRRAAPIPERQPRIIIG